MEFITYLHMYLYEYIQIIYVSIVAKKVVCIKWQTDWSNMLFVEKHEHKFIKVLMQHDTYICKCYG